MIIKKKYVRSIKNYLDKFETDKKFYLCKQINTNIDKRVLKKYGFDFENSNIQTYEPNPIKRYTSLNVNGEWKIHRDLPKVSRDIEKAYHIIDWHGDPHDGVCFQTRECYQRTYKKPKLVELSLYNNLLISPLFTNTTKQYEKITLTANILLEMFGEFEFRSESLAPSLPPTEVKRVKWKILPIGETPWKNGKKYLTPIIKNVPGAKRPVIEKRHNYIWNFQPKWCAIGSGGFSGYVVYGFPEKHRYIFESNQYNNATYIFNKDNWKSISKLTKKDIIFGNLEEDRIIHNHSWYKNINKTMSKLV